MQFNYIQLFGKKQGVLLKKCAFFSFPTPVLSVVNVRSGFSMPLLRQPDPRRGEGSSHFLFLHFGA